MLFKYIVEEKNHKGKVTSHLETSNPWLCFSDVMVKISSGIKQGERVHCMPMYNFSDFSLRIYSFLYVFICQSGNIREITVKTVPMVKSGTFYSKKLTSEVYLRDSYIDALKKTVVHVQEFLGDDVSGLFVLFTYGLSCADHPVWGNFKGKFGSFEVNMICVLAM